jgi:hypothetical protein
MLCLKEISVKSRQQMHGFQMTDQDAVILIFYHFYRLVRPAPLTGQYKEFVLIEFNSFSPA